MYIDSSSEMKMIMQRTWDSWWTDWERKRERTEWLCNSASASSDNFYV